ncbi:hypothetical protein MXB_2545 [Myxobolus squamalis]|nr:hypothetical protein MXB_2545 [Myxobolus squamalis]
MNKVIDASPLIDINFSDHFTYHGTIGIYGNVYFYGFISGIKFVGHWIRIDSIYWHRDQIITTFKSIKSRKGLLTINISFKHLCNGYFGKNCQNECFAIPGVSICDDITGKMWCLGPNGRLNCQNSKPCLCLSADIKNCPVYEQKNENCIGISDENICLCDYSFNRPLQHNVLCNNECNGVGTCVGPNRCVCAFSYFGDLCDEYACEEDFKDHCYNYGTVLIRFLCLF